jgi:hypothetical protein
MQKFLLFALKIFSASLVSPIHIVQGGSASGFRPSVILIMAGIFSRAGPADQH